MIFSIPLARTYKCSWTNQNSWRNSFFVSRFFLLQFKSRNNKSSNGSSEGFWKGLVKAMEGKGTDTLETALYENTWKLAILSHKKLEENVVRFFARVSIHFPSFEKLTALSFFFLPFLFSFLPRIVCDQKESSVSRLPRSNKLTLLLIIFSLLSFSKLFKLQRRDFSYGNIFL